jgi:hypothetical protein
MILYNVAYDSPSDKTTRHYCDFPMGRKDALKYLRLFRERYVGKPYPNGEGFYDFRNARLVELRVGE